MKQLKFSKETSMASLVFFIVYGFYGAFRIPFVQYAACLSLGAVAYGMTMSYEIGIIALLVVNFIFTLFTVCVMPGKEKSGFMDTPAAIAGRIQGMSRASSGGVLPGVGSKMSEGFADASGNDGVAPEETENTEDVTAESKPAPAPAAAPAHATAEKKKETSGFEGSKDLFKLGSLPSDAKGGAHIDAGTTMMNALKSLKPEQITSMTQDTKQLIETQKNLMDVLKTFSPMISEGRDMMQMFNGMFGGSAGALPGAGLPGATPAGVGAA